MTLATRGFLASMACAGLALPAAGQYTEGFEYGNGGLVGNGDWEEWCGSSGVDGAVTDEQAHTGSFSMRVDPNDDVTQRFAVTSGSFTLSIFTYVPSTSPGTTWVIGLNTYPDCDCAGAFNWSIQCTFDPAFNLVTDLETGQQITMTPDAWRKLQWDVDLDADEASISYQIDDQGTMFTFSTRPYSQGGVTEFRVLDLFSDSGIMYYDDVEVTAGSDPCTTGPCVGTITSAAVGFGSNVGPLDIAKLQADDNDRAIGKSKTFLSALEPNLTRIDATVDMSSCLGGGPEVTLDIQDQASQPNVTNRVKLFPAGGGAAQQVGQYAVTFNVDADHQIVVANGGDFIQGNGDIDMELRYSTIALLSPLGFDARIDLLETSAN